MLQVASVIFYVCFVCGFTKHTHTHTKYLNNDITMILYYDIIIIININNMNNMFERLKKSLHFYLKNTFIQQKHNQKLTLTVKQEKNAWNIL